MKPAMPQAAVLAIDLGLAFAGLGLFSILPGGDGLYLEPSTWFLPLGAFLAAFLASGALKRPFYGFLPQVLDPIGIRRRLPLRPLYVLLNLRFPLLLSMCALMGFLQSATLPIEEEYPIVRGSILLLVKNNAKYLNGTNASVPKANDFVRRLSFHVVQGVKQAVNALAEESARRVRAGKRSARVGAAMKAAAAFDLEKAWKALADRVRYQGKPPILLYEFQGYFYSGAGVPATQVTEKITNDSTRMDPSIRGPYSFKRFVFDEEGLLEAYQDRDQDLVSLPRPSGDLPDSSNFINSFYGRAMDAVFYSSSEKAKAEAGFLEPPAARPLLIWVSDDGYEPSPLPGYPARANFRPDRKDHPLRADRQSLSRRLMGDFFGPSCLVLYQGLQRLTTSPDYRGRTILENLGDEGLFTEILRMPEIDYFAPPAKERADEDRALRAMHAGLSAFLSSNHSGVLDVEVHSLRKPAQAFSYDIVFFTIILPAMLFAMTTALRHLAFLRVER